MSDARSLLLAPPVQPTRLAEDPAVAALRDLGTDAFLDVVARHPESSLCWALLAEGALTSHTREGDLTAYAFARTGYHRGLDALRRAGWRGRGPVPWKHEPNQGVLRSIWALACAAKRIGEDREYERCVAFLVDSDEEAYTHLVSTRPLSL